MEIETAALMSTVWPFLKAPLPPTTIQGKITKYQAERLSAKSKNYGLIILTLLQKKTST